MGQIITGAKGVKRILITVESPLKNKFRVQLWREKLSWEIASVCRIQIYLHKIYTANVYKYIECYMYLQLFYSAEGKRIKFMDVTVEREDIKKRFG